MVKTKDNSLCYKAGPKDCSRCFPHFRPADFKRRELIIKSLMLQCDGFIASSRFLKQRYIEWGLPEEKLTVIDNGFPRRKDTASAAASPDSGTGKRFAYFGQLTAWKGVDVLLKAFSLLPDEIKNSISLDIYGANLEKQHETFQQKVQQLFDENPEVVFHGPYQNSQLPSLMNNVDWVVVPSIWWENSPLVIQEARIHGKAVICSNLGGMAEKVQHGVTGLTFDVGNPDSLAKTITEAATTAGLHTSISANQPEGPWVDEIANDVLSYYETLKLRKAERPKPRRLKTSAEDPEEPESSAPIFILGAARSGTSILAHSLLFGAKIKGHHEGHLLPLLFYLLRAIDVYALKRKRRKESQYTLFSEETLAEVRRDLKRSFQKIQESVYPTGLWVDKTPDNEMIKLVPVLYELWPNARFIFAKRRSIENLLSRAIKFPDHDFRRGCETWADAMESWLEVRDSIPKDQQLEIEQRLISTDPEGTASQLGNFLDLTDNQIQEIQDRFTNKRPERTGPLEEELSISIEETSWDAEQIELFNKICLPLNEAYGYSTDSSYFSS